MKRVRSRCLDFLRLNLPGPMNNLHLYHHVEKIFEITIGWDTYTPTMAVLGLQTYTFVVRED